MPVRYLTSAATADARIGKKIERSMTKERGQDGKDFAYFIPFFLTEKKGGKKERPGRKR